ncbi:gamma-glutamyl-gamma-aminobutyrate hydrolase family protein [Sporosarcina siberiensis]|uniref:Gamma-glutamyl-gamma-aminobutyrate hydrolase family protein n=1 Tax=Sporosarcina siberiensis TaxID=1365606 RepID=A0ABW4SG94_9BACL
MKPIIGITTDTEKNYNHVLNYEYVKAVKRAGGLPLIIPVGIEEDISQIAAMLDGLLASGGNDISPLLFDEEPLQKLGEVSPGRDAIEIDLVREMLKLDKPIFGICRGMQVLNVAVGGNIYQDLYAQNEGTLLQHIQNAPNDYKSHYVQITKGSLFEKIAETDKITVNSYHHQSVKDVPMPLIINGKASDGIIESLESTEHRFVIGVQWHPEILSNSGDAVSLRLFERFIEACTEK